MKLSTMRRVSVAGAVLLSVFAVASLLFSTLALIHTSQSQAREAQAQVSQSRANNTILHELVHLADKNRDLILRIDRLSKTGSKQSAQAIECILLAVKHIDSPVCGLLFHELHRAAGGGSGGPGPSPAPGPSTSPSHSPNPSPRPSPTRTLHPSPRPSVCVPGVACVTLPPLQLTKANADSSPLGVALAAVLLVLVAVAVWLRRKTERP